MRSPGSRRRRWPSGSALGAAQGYPVSLERLRLWATTLDDKGLVLAPVSALVIERSGLAAEVREPWPGRPAVPRLSAAGPQPGYRPCVGLMLLNPANLLFIGERRGPLLEAWQMPQGGIDPGETPLAAARRELREEVGTDRAELLAESRQWFAYDLPQELMPAALGRRATAARASAGSPSASPAPTPTSTSTPTSRSSRAGAGRAPTRCWHLIVPFKRPVYEAVLSEFADLLR